MAVHKPRPTSRTWITRFKVAGTIYRWDTFLTDREAAQAFEDKLKASMHRAAHDRRGNKRRLPPLPRKVAEFLRALAHDQDSALPPPDPPEGHDPE